MSNHEKLQNPRSIYPHKATPRRSLFHEIENTIDIHFYKAWIHLTSRFSSRYFLIVLAENMTSFVNVSTRIFQNPRFSYTQLSN